MDLTDIILAAIGGGIGGALGGLLGQILPKGRDGTMGMLGMAAMIGLALAGGRFLPAYLEPYLGPHIRAFVAEAEVAELEASIAVELESEPFFIALQENAPERAETWRLAVLDAYRSGGRDEALAVSGQMGEEIGVWLIETYAPRATDEALLAYYSELYALTSGPLADHPDACYGFFFPDQFEGSPPTPDLTDMGIDPMPMARRMAELTNGAADELVPYDASLIPEVQQLAGMALIETMGAENVDLLGERRPMGRADYALACDGMGAFFGAILEAENGVVFLRALASSEG